MEGRRVNRPWSAILVLSITLAGLARSGAVNADEIRLRHGGVVSGRIISESDRQLIVEVPYGRITIPRRDVLEITRAGESEYLREASERILKAGDVSKALDLVRRAFELAPEDPGRRSELLRTLERATDQRVEARRLGDAEALLDEHRALGGDPAVESPIRERIRILREERASRERRAIAAWHEGSFETAHRLWSELRTENPHRAERWRKPLAAAALRLGHDALLGRRLEPARARYLETLELDPDRLLDVREPFALCEIERIRPYLQQGRFDEADHELRAALEILPDDPAILFHLALIEEAKGDYRAAGKIYAQLAGEHKQTIEGQKYLEELRQKAAERVQRGVALLFSAEPELPVGRTDLELRGSIQGGPFVVHHVEGFDAEGVLDALRRDLSHFEASWFGGQPALPSDLEVAVFLHPGREALLAQGAPQISGCDGFVRTDRRYGILVRQEVHLNGDAARLTSAVVPHELVHLLLPHRIGRGLVLPPWLEEGIACSEEPELLRRHRRRTLLDAARSEVQIPLAELFGAEKIPEASAPLFYAASASIVEFLRERLGLLELLVFAKRVALGGVEPALSEVAGYDSVADLEYAWRRWLEK